MPWTRRYLGHSSEVLSHNVSCKLSTEQQPSSETGHSLLVASFPESTCPSAVISYSVAPSNPHTTGYLALVEPPAAGTYRAAGENAAKSAVCLAFGEWLASDPCAAGRQRDSRLGGQCSRVVSITGWLPVKRH